MTSADILYRAIRELEGDLEQERGTSSFINAMVRAPEPDDLTVTHNVCTIEDDWISAIERGLVYIGRAIDEDRQFIRSNGEIQPIEKVRHVSKESVQHLSRHSDFLPKDQKKDEDIVPNKLYTVERLNDYAVYENRFLYVLLLRIRDFVGVRYEAIMRAYRSYRGEYIAKKNVVMGTRRFSMQFRFTDEQEDVVSAPADKECAKSLDRLDKIRQSVAFFLRTPLMVEVSRADKIKSKITKTNVLRMNKNFHEALTLYEYLLAYEKDGYTIEERVEKLDPISEKAARQLALPAVVASFLVYEHGLKLEDFLEEEYEKEEARREEEAKDAFAREIAALKRRIEETGEGVEQYMLMLEKQNAALEKDRKLLKEAREEIEDLNAEIDRLKQEIAALNEEIEQLNAEIVRLNEEMQRREEEHRREMEEQRQRYEQQLEELRAAHAEEIARLNEEHRMQLEELRAAHAEELASLKAAHEEEVATLKTAHAEEVAALKAAQAEELTRLKEAQRAQIEALKAESEQALARMEQSWKAENERIRAACEKSLCEKEIALSAREQDAARVRQELSETEEKLTASVRKCDVFEAQLIAIRKEHGLLTEKDDFTTEEGFNRLEHAFEVLGRLVRDEWTEVKKILRREFKNDIRATIHQKKIKKSKEYAAFGEQLRVLDDAEKAENAENAENAEKEVETQPTPAEKAEAEKAENGDGTDGE